MIRNRYTVAIVALVVLSALTFGLFGAAAQQETPTPTPDNETTPTPGDETDTNETDTNETDTNETDINETDINETDTNETAETASVTFEDQSSNGSAVNVSSATLPEGGFVVVYDATLESPLGSSSFIEADGQENVTDGQENVTDGQENVTDGQENVSISLDRTLLENTTLVAIAYTDTNENQAFEFRTDEVYVTDGELAAAAANVTVSTG